MPVVKCKNCGKEFEVKPYDLKRGRGKFCSKECYDKYRQVKITKKCLNCGKKFTVHKCRAETARFCSQECYDEYRKTKVTKKCEYCGKEFEATRFEAKNRKYCSKKCADLAKRERIKKICKNCGKEFEVTPYFYDKIQFCSKECRVDWVNKHHRVKVECAYCGREFYVPKKKLEHQKQFYCSDECREKVRGRVKRTCEYCGREFYVIPAKVDNGRGKFCSKECYANWRSENLRGPNNWNFNSIRRVCEFCGKEFYSPPSIVAQGYGKYCSRKCQNRALLNRQKTKRPTKPEKAFMKICQKYNLPFKYVGDWSYWIGDLNPDFISTNGQKIVVEIFGVYWHSPIFNPNVDKKMTKEYREKYYSKRGWKTIVIWENEVYDEERVLKILEENKIKITRSEN